jgi:hypothetical protein
MAGHELGEASFLCAPGGRLFGFVNRPTKLLVTDRSTAVPAYTVYSSLCTHTKHGEGVTLILRLLSAQPSSPSLSLVPITEKRVRPFFPFFFPTRRTIIIVGSISPSCNINAMMMVEHQGNEDLQVITRQCKIQLLLLVFIYMAQKDAGVADCVPCRECVVSTTVRTSKYCAFLCVWVKKENKKKR